MNERTKVEDNKKRFSRGEQNGILSRIYSEMKFNVVPIHPDSKSPCEAWQRWQEKRVPPHILIRWYRGEFFGKSHQKWKLPDSPLFGVITGARPWTDQPGIVVVDCDDAEAVELANLLPATPMAQTTPSGGRHLIYRRPSIESCPTRLKARIGGRSYNLDIKADGGYVLMPGCYSRKREASYVWDEPWTPSMLHQCPVFNPRWLPDDRGDARPPAEVCNMDYYTALEQCGVPLSIRIAQARSYLACCKGTVQSEGTGGADGYCFAVAMTTVWGFMLPIEDAVEVLHEWGQRDDCVDSAGNWYPWKWKEINSKVRGASSKAYYGKPGDKLSYRELTQDEEAIAKLFE